MANGPRQPDSPGLSIKRNLERLPEDGTMHPYLTVILAEQRTADLRAAR